MTNEYWVTITVLDIYVFILVLALMLCLDLENSMERKLLEKKNIMLLFSMFELEK